MWIDAPVVAEHGTGTVEPVAHTQRFAVGLRFEL